jgi:membrane-associated phospholipid phosphatase
MTALERQTRNSARNGFVGFRPRHVWTFVAAFLLAAAFYLDFAVVAWVRANETPGMLGFMRGVSRWGDWPTHVAVGLIGLAISYARSSREWTSIFAAMLIAVIVGSTANRVVKIAAGRARPSVQTDAGWKGLRWTSKYNSFPSGHTATSTSFFATLFFARKRIGRWLLAIPFLIALSRMYVSAHYLSDVVFGATLGIAAAFLVWREVKTRAPELSKPRH